MELKIKAFDELTAEQLFSIYRLRVAVFVVEQSCPYQEVDDADRKALHVWLEDNGEIAAYLRVIPKDAPGREAAIGRVVSARRRRGLGSRVLAEGMRAAQERLGADTLTLEAQTYAVPLYLKAGFVQISEEFLEDGIPHVKMQWKAPKK